MASILVVDDTPAIRRLVERLLVSAGHSVAQAANGKEALRTLDAGNFDLVVTDVVMPEMEGLELIRSIRKTYPKMKIIGMSGGGRGSASEYLTMARAFGAATTLEKPFENDELLDAVKSVLDAPAGKPPG